MIFDHVLMCKTTELNDGVFSFSQSCFSNFNFFENHLVLMHPCTLDIFRFQLVFCVFLLNITLTITKIYFIHVSNLAHVSK